MGGNWNIGQAATASSGGYVVVKPDMQSIEAAPTGSEDYFYITFTAEKDTAYHLFGRLFCPTENDDSFWLKMDNGSFTAANYLITTGGWEWIRITSYALTAGEHTLTSAYRENGANLDKICISSYIYPPEGLGGEAENVCVVGINEAEDFNTFNLSQNYPNPFNPVATVTYEIAQAAEVSLIVYDLLGREVTRLADGYLNPGYCTVQWDGREFASGVYIARMLVPPQAGVTPGYSKSIKMLLLK